MPRSPSPAKSPPIRSVLLSLVLAEAIGYYEQALRIKPDYVQARNKLERLQ